MQLLKFIGNHFVNRVIKDNHGWVWPLVFSTLASAGVSQLGKSGGGDEGSFEYPADYPEAEGARRNWWERLQQWGSQPGYGAISPDWGDIWEKAKNRVNRYYWGGPAEGEGLAGKVKASAARRGVSESPALERNLANLGMQQGIQLGEMATDQATQEAQFSETGRTNWLNSLMQLAGLKRSTQYVPGQDNSAMYSGMGEGISSIIGQVQQQNWLENLLKSSGQTTSGGSSLPTSTPNNYQLFGGTSNPWLWA